MSSASIKLVLEWTGPLQVLLAGGIRATWVVLLEDPLGCQVEAEERQHGPRPRSSGGSLRLRWSDSRVRLQRFQLLLYCMSGKLSSQDMGWEGGKSGQDPGRTSCSSLCCRRRFATRAGWFGSLGRRGAGQRPNSRWWHAWWSTGSSIGRTSFFLFFFFFFLFIISGDISASTIHSLFLSSGGGTEQRNGGNRQQP